MPDSPISLMSLLFAAAHSSRRDPSLRRALRVWRETGVVPEARIGDAVESAELAITLGMPSAPRGGLVS
jgi:hypothetical protein